MDVEQLFALANRARRPAIVLCSDVEDHACKWCGLTDELVSCPSVSGADCYYKSGTRILNEDGLMTCVTCGRSDWDYVSDEPEWNSNADGEGPDMCRVGAPVNTTLYSESWGTGTIISTKGASFAGKRMSRINFHTSMNHRDRSLHHAYEDMDRVGKTNLNLPDSVMLQAKVMYRKFSEEKLTRGAVRTGIKANCIARACSDAGVSRTIQEIADAFGIPARDMSRTTELFTETIPENKVEPSVVTKPSDLVARMFNEVTCVPEAERGRVRQKVIQVCRENERNVRLMGKTPKGVVSAVMFVTLSTLGFEVDKEEIRRVCDVSMPTLNKLMRVIKV